MNKIKSYLMYNFDVFDYSGRGMMGKTCTAVRISNQVEFFADVLETCPEDLVQEMADAIRSSKMDSLGRDIVLYFPQID